jgi:hypothetical protein
MTWLIDRSGEICPKTAHRIAQWDSECDPVEYAVSDLGFVHLRVVNDGMTVKFNPSRVNKRAMISAFYVIASERPRRIALAPTCIGPDVEIFGSSVAAFRRIEELVETTGRMIPVFLQRQRSFNDLPKSSLGSLIEILHGWHHVAGRWTTERHVNICTQVPRKDTIVVRNARATDRLVNDYWGTNFDFVDDRWVQVAHGKDVEDQPFPEIGRRIARQYRRTLEDGVPCLYDADFKVLGGGGSIMRHRQCMRLVIPWIEDLGDRYLTVIRFDHPDASRI